MLGASSPEVLAPWINMVSASLGAILSEIQLPYSVNCYSKQAECGYEFNVVIRVYVYLVL